ncbi:serine/threonine-protein kinase SBK1-like [Cherax quadricarinatus]
MGEVRRSSSIRGPQTVELPKLEIDRQFAEVRLLKENGSIKVFSARCLESDSSSVALKSVQKDAIKKKDFLQEFYYNSLLSFHSNIYKCFDQVFETETSYVLVQELSKLGHLSEFVRRGGMGELGTKTVVKQIAQALEFMHERDLVHSDICTENIFVFDRKFSLVKLGCFSKTQQEGALVKKLKVGSPWAPPEVSVAVYNEGYHVHRSQDAWQLGILIFVCLTGSYPWSSADITDRHYNSWVAWLKRKTTKMPPRFRCFTPRLLRLLRRLLEPKPKKRLGVKELYKYLPDVWHLRETHAANITLNDTLSKFLSDGAKSLFTRTETKMVAVLRHYLRQIDSQPQEDKRRVSFVSEEGEATSRLESQPKECKRSVSFASADGGAASHSKSKPKEYKRRVSFASDGVLATSHTSNTSTS